MGFQLWISKRGHLCLAQQLQLFPTWKGVFQVPVGQAVWEVKEGLSTFFPWRFHHPSPSTFFQLCRAEATGMVVSMVLLPTGPDPCLVLSDTTGRTCVLTLKPHHESTLLNYQ